jgi:hypothetical protein
LGRRLDSARLAAEAGPTMKTGPAIHRVVETR